MFTIGVLARRAQCSVPAVRFYEAQGLMPPAERREGGHRVYGRPDLARLLLIRRLRDLDVPLDRIKAFLKLDEGGKPCAETLAFFQEQRDAIRQRIEALRDLDLSLSLHMANCQSGCLPAAKACDLYGALST
ncbi:cadR [Asticcacaulis biprosthecium C19]|uniref:CadR n=1 Tax=Asticcacaulis biprosthecium C19 TaxID=715226 RepID=F4QPS6_9CAUL|nr:MerR family transcriptional regulator [Asticcacaulis biprosthecium]EGF90213.1 cadR [Asticcacaulis biprosthecium C19]